MNLKPTILIIEDDMPTLKVLKNSLHRFMDCCLYTAANGIDAIAKLREHDFDLVISDIHMPGLNGLDVLREARKQGRFPDFIMLTAWDSAQIAQEAIREGALDYIPKPLQLPTLRLKIKDILSQKHCLAS